MTETPTDTPTVTRRKKSRSDKGKSNPNRAKRKRLLGSGEGDYCIYEVASPNSDFPNGSLIPIPNVPRFNDTVQARRWINHESGDLLAGKQVMIFRAMALMTVSVEMTPKVMIREKPRVDTPPPSSTEDGE